MLPLDYSKCGRVLKMILYTWYLEYQTSAGYFKHCPALIYLFIYLFVLFFRLKNCYSHFYQSALLFNTSPIFRNTNNRWFVVRSMRRIAESRVRLITDHMAHKRWRSIQNIITFSRPLPLFVTNPTVYFCRIRF